MQRIKDVLELFEFKRVYYGLYILCIYMGTLGD